MKYGRRTRGLSLRPLDCWGYGCEYRRKHGCPSLVDVVCCQAESFATGRSLVQRSPTESACHWVRSDATVTLYTHNQQAEDFRIRNKSNLAHKLKSTRKETKRILRRWIVKFLWPTLHSLQRALHVDRHIPQMYSSTVQNLYHGDDNPSVTEWAVEDAGRIYTASPGKVVVSGGVQTASFTYHR
jgi:hypothetical protein